MIIRVLALLSVAVVGSAFAADTVDVDAYSRCTEAAVKPKGDPKDALAACAGPAAQGVPGAQYAMGAFLMNTAKGAPPPEAAMWLEKAVASGHAGAAYVLALLLGAKNDPSQRERMTQLMIQSACGDYKPALAQMKSAGVTKEQLRCPARTDADFSGQWSGTLQWLKAGPSAAGGPEMKVVISGGQASVFMKSKGDWFDVKPGKWHVSQVEQTVVLSAIDEGSDFDGVWIEAWDVHLLRLNADEAVMSYMRTVNNRDMPTSLSWRTFTTVAEGHVLRSMK